MRSHAKASSAGSTNRQAKVLGCSLLLALLVSVLAAMPALAAETYVSTGSFGAAGSGDGQFSLASNSGVAVNETSHDVYVADTGNHRVVQFDSVGNFIRAFGADVGGAGVNTCTTGCVAGTAGTSPGALESPTFIAVDNSSGPSKGDVYVADTANNAVSKFQADGTLVSSWGSGGQLDGSTASGGPFGPLAGVAVDSAGNLFAFQAVPAGLWFKFAQDAGFTTSFGAARGTVANGVAVAPDGALFKVNGDFTVEKFSGTGTDVGQVNKTTTGAGLAVDPSSGDLFIDDGTSISRYVFAPSGEVVGSSCTPVPFSGCAPTASFGSGDLTLGGGIAADGTLKSLYVADFGAAHIAAFESVLLPDATTGEATEADTDSAVLHGTVSAANGADASCEFQYTTKVSFEAEGFTGATGVPCTPAGPFSGATVNAVSAEVTGLTVGTEYRFRVVGTSASGSGFGDVHSFHTSAPPTVSEPSVEAVGTSDAVLTAMVNPKGTGPATYHVEYGATASYGQSTPESAPIGFAGDESSHGVSVHIGGLSPGTAYHFRFVATNSVGDDKGIDVSFATYPVAPTFGSCANDGFRTGFGATLPDCRAYEQVTPADKHGANVEGSWDNIQASSAGDRIDFFLLGGLPTTGGSTTLGPFLASRGAAGWSSNGLVPPTPPGRLAEVRGWSEDMSSSLSVGPAGGADEQALYIYDDDSRTFNQSGPAFPYIGNPFPGGVAADGSHLIFATDAALAPGGVLGRDNLYELDHGEITLAGRIPDLPATSCDDEGGTACVPAPEGSFAGPYEWAWALNNQSNLNEGGSRSGYYTQNTISRDGSRIVFTAGGTGRLYVREDGSKTTQISASQRTVPDPSGEKPAAFLAATPDGSKVFFLSCEKLTDDSTAFSTAANTCTTFDQGEDLYSYDVDTKELTDLTVDSGSGNPKGADVRGILGVSADGSYVYFVANGALAPGASPPQLCQVTPDATCNLYVNHNGTTTFIAALSGDGSDTENWKPRSRSGAQPKTSRVAANGNVVIFASKRNLTGKDNVGPCVKENFGGFIQAPCTEVFRYSADTDELTCVSCTPTRISPRGNASLGSRRGLLGGVVGLFFLARNLSADGDRAFFETPDALVSTDTNGVTDVYEWEAKGSGTCESESQNGGCLYLISSGRSPDPSYFGDASSNGDHVFFFTPQALVPGDRDDLIDIYDAGVGAGLSAQHALAPPTCSATACQANPPPPPDPGISSSSFQGPGNARPRPAARKCPKGKRKVRRAGKVSCQSAHKQHKRHSNRGGSK